MPLRAQVDDLPLAGDQRHGARDEVPVYVTLHGFVETFQALGGHADALRCRSWQLLSGQRRHESEGCGDRQREGGERTPRLRRR